METLQWDQADRQTDVKHLGATNIIHLNIGFSKNLPYGITGIVVFSVIITYKIQKLILYIFSYCENTI